MSTAAPVLDDVDTTVDLMDLVFGSGAKCEASELRHGGRECAIEATHRLVTCTSEALLCSVATARVRARMAAGSRCDMHRHRIDAAWRLIPV